MIDLGNFAGVYSILYIYILYMLLLFVLLGFIIYEYKEKKKIIAQHAKREFDLSAQYEKNLSLALTRQAEAQRRVIKGKVSEELFPLMANCPYLPADMKFFGSPVDYLILDGYSDAKDDRGEFRDVIFADIKTGNAKLSAHQKKIKQAIQAGRVRWETIRIGDDGSIVFERD